MGVILRVIVGVPVNEGAGEVVAVGGVPITLNSPRTFHSVPTKNTNWYVPGSHCSAGRFNTDAPEPPVPLSQELVLYFT